MEKILEQSMLYDFYGELLNEHQKEIFEYYVFDNLSLSEIAQMKNISRQGVHDILKRSTRILESYEEKLHLIERFIQIKELINEIDNKTNQTEIKKISEHILDKL